MIPTRFNLLARLRDASITTKLGGIAAVFLLAFVGLVLLVAPAFYLTSGVRAYVAAEGLWSKGQKDAVYFLSRYLDTEDERDYQRFQQALAVPLGDRKARMALTSPDLDTTLATEGFIAGGNAPADIPSMIFLFRNFREVGFLAQAIRIWTEADVQADRLRVIAGQVHEAVTRQRLDRHRADQFAEQISQINDAVTPLEKNFSQTLIEGSHWLQLGLFVVIGGVALLLLALGLHISRVISRDLSAGIDALRDGALRVARGDLEHRIAVRSDDELGQLATVFNAMIGRRREAELALTEANEFRDKVMQSATNAIYTMDIRGAFTMANLRTCQITGYPIEELLGLSWGRLIPPEQLPDLLARFQDTIEGRAPILNYELPLRRKDGVVVQITCSIAALSRNGMIVGVVGAAEDITARKRDELELKSRADELLRSNQELEQFAYVASHDLQEPLRTVSGFAQLLEKRYGGKLGSDADEYIHYVTTGAARMKSLIEDLLSYARVAREAGAMQRVDLNRALATALANLQAAIQAAGATVSSEPLPTVEANERQMVQLFQNLIANAVKFRREEPPVVRISAEQTPEGWQFSVRDNGIGISPRNANQIFGLFQRLHGRDKYPGNGIGLTICKKIVDLHGGRIWVTPGESGAVFRFTLNAVERPVVG